MSFLKPKFKKETREALERGAERGRRVVPGGAVNATGKLIAKSFKVPGQRKAVRVINGWGVNGARELTKKIRGSWK